MSRSSDSYVAEVQKAFDFTVKTGFVTMCCFDYLLGLQSRPTKFRLQHALLESGLFVPCYSRVPLQALKLAPAGRRLARLQGKDPSPPPRFASYFHDSLVLSIALELEKIGLASSWTPESELIKVGQDRLCVASSRAGKKYPDLLISTGNLTPKTIALELEISRKSMGRYEQFMRGYMGTRGIDAVLIVYQNPVVRECLETAIRRVRLSPAQLPIHFMDLREFQNGQGTVQITFGMAAADQLTRLFGGQCSLAG